MAKSCASFLSSRAANLTFSSISFCTSASFCVFSLSSCVVLATSLVSHKTNSAHNLSRWWKISSSNYYSFNILCKLGYKKILAWAQQKVRSTKFKAYISSNKSTSKDKWHSLNLIRWNFIKVRTFFLFCTTMLLGHTTTNDFKMLIGLSKRVMKWRILELKLSFQIHSIKFYSQLIIN